MSELCMILKNHSGCRQEYEENFHFALKTRRRVSTGIFSAKTVTQEHGFEPTISCLPGRRTTNCAMMTRTPKLVFTEWNNKVEIWQNWEEKTKHRL